MASPTQWTGVRVNSGSWWWTGRPGMLQSMGWQSIRHGWVTELIMPLAGFIFFVCSEFYVYFFPSKIKFCCSGYDFTLDFFVVISSTIEPRIILASALIFGPIAETLSSQLVAIRNASMSYLSFWTLHAANLLRWQDDLIYPGLLNLLLLSSIIIYNPQ